MLSSGLCSSEQNELRKYNNRFNSSNLQLKTFCFSQNQNDSIKAGSHLVKNGQSDGTDCMTRCDESYASNLQQMHPPINQELVESGPFCRGVSFDPCPNAQASSYTTFSSTDVNVASSEYAPGVKCITTNPNSNHMPLSPGLPTVAQTYAPHLQSYVPSVPCIIPDCSICHPLIPHSAYIPAHFASRSTAPSSVLTPNFAPGSLDPASGGVGCCSPCYLLIGQTTTAQKQFMQAQLALSQLSLGISNTVTPASDCSLSASVTQSCSTSGNTVSVTFPRDSVVSTGRLPSSTQQATMSHAMKEAAIPSSSYLAPIVQKSTDLVAPLCNSPGSTDSSRLGQPSYCGSATERASTVSPEGVSSLVPPDAPIPSNWATANYLGANTLWIPPAYAQQYFQPLPLSIGSVPPTSVVNFNDHMMLSNMVGRPYRGNGRSDISMQNYYAPAASIPAIPTYTNAAKFPLHKTCNAIQGINPSSLHPTPSLATTSTQPLSSAHWQLLWNALAASKQSAGLLQPHPLSPYGVTLDRSGLTRRRMNTTTSVRNSACIGFDLAELTSLRLSVNPTEFDDSILFRARFFIIKSDCEYNVHQSIRHGVWCSTRAGNQCLDEAYSSVQVQRHNIFGENSGLPNTTSQPTPTTVNSKGYRAGHVLLIFSTRSSGYLSGVAEMIGPVNPQKRCSIWQDGRFRGEIPVRWIYVKSVPNSLVKHILIESYDNRPVTVLRDTSEILPANKGEELLRIIHAHNNPQRILPQGQS